MRCVFKSQSTITLHLNAELLPVSSCLVLGEDTGFQDRGFKCVKGGSIYPIFPKIPQHENEIVCTQGGRGGGGGKQKFYTVHFYAVVFEKLYSNYTNFISQCHFRPFSLIELKLHKSQTNSIDATWRFGHVPSINCACKFQLIRSLHCDNRTVYITNAWELKNVATLNLTSWFLLFSVWRLCFSYC